MQLDSFTITFLFILLTTVFAAFFRRKNRDKCLRSFEGDNVVIEKINGENIPEGRLNVENTGLEIIYNNKVKGEFGLLKTSCLFYKYEFPQIQAILRYVDKQDEKALSRRANDLEKIYHPGFFRRTRRKINNIFKTIKDSFAEVLNLLISQVQKAGTTGKMLKEHNKYVAQIKDGLIESVGSAYEPLMEKYIGHYVVIELIRGEKKEKYAGILKDYTSAFIELYDVDYGLKKDTTKQKADIIFPQKLCVVRHLGEIVEKKDLVSKLMNLEKK